MEPLSSFPLVTVLGGSGFLGRAVVEAFASRGWRVRVVSRFPDRALRLKPSGDIGQIGLIRGDIRDPESIRPAIRDARAVINLVGILDEREERFEDISRGAVTVAALAQNAGAEAFLHVSAVGASPGGATGYQRSKARGEKLVQEVLPGAAIVRPALLFGAEDGFTNQFAKVAAMSSCAVPVIYPEVRIQPVYVNDVAKGILALVERQLAGEFGQRAEFAGPEVLTIAQFVRAITDSIGVERRQWRLSPGLARFLSMFPGVPLTKDQIALMSVGSMPTEGAPGLQSLGIAPTPFESVAREWLTRYRPGGRFGNER